MAREWDIKRGNPSYDFLEVIETAFTAAVAPGGILEETATKVVVGGDTHTVVLKGNFVYTDGDPGPDSGTVNTIKVFDGSTLVAKATGYELDVDWFDGPFEDLANFGDFNGFLSLFFATGAPSGPWRITLNGSDERDVLSIPADVPHTFYGNGGSDRFVASMSGDRILGGDGKDTLKGRGGDDKIKGGKGADKIFGGELDDALTGGKGTDKFFFDIALGNGFSKAGVDTITDFKVGTDVIKLDGTIFAAIGSKLNNSEFHVGGNAQDGNDHVVYKKGAGKLFYDADGNGAGGKILFAKFDGKPNLTHDDFDII
ncbi:MAG: calcium-binding protein [Hyphomicrobiales bacterium]|nr:calcium-binding protein [Hyphomicrobiales bacterium]